MRIVWLLLLILLGGMSNHGYGQPDATPSFGAQILPLVKTKCVRCHGPTRSDAQLNLALPTGIKRGGKSGSLVVPGDPEASLLWKQVADDLMPKDEEPLSEREKELLYSWIKAGAPGLPVAVSERPDGEEHQGYQKLQSLDLPQVIKGIRVRTPVDRFIQAKLEEHQLELGPEADPTTLIRRVSFDLTGLPPTLDQIRQYLSDSLPEAYERMVDRFLASPHYGERWGKYWLDAAGYADSNGYFNADTDRPLAWRYRDYVIAAINADMPFDQFIREQLAGDELARYTPEKEVSDREIEMLTATHYLRNSADGTDSSDGNEDEVRADKYAVLEGTLQIMGSSLFGMTFQCARCHDHKFEPLTQADYYSLQAVLYPAFNVDQWAKPKDRQVPAVRPSQWKACEEAIRAFDAERDQVKQERTEWLKLHPEPLRLVFSDDFDDPSAPLSLRWANHAPGDIAPLGLTEVSLDSATAPSVLINDGYLSLKESGAPGDRAISTKNEFDWTPEPTGSWVQVSFDLVQDATYVGYLLAIHDYNDTQAGVGGNVLLDGAGTGKAKVYLDYPGGDSSSPGAIGESGYKAGRRYGVRVTNVGDGMFELAQLVDSVPESNTLKVPAKALPNGGFGFALCCGRSFAVDRVRIETSVDSAALTNAEIQVMESHKAAQAAFASRLAQLESQRPQMPGKLAPVTDLSEQPPEVFLLDRGNYKERRSKVEPAPPGFLREPGEIQGFSFRPDDLQLSTGRRLGLAQWLTAPGSRASSLLARVTVNRWWQHHFGAGLVSTTDNLGYSGTPATHPELLEYLAAELIRRGWSQKSFHRLIVNSTAYRQVSMPSTQARRLDADNRLVSHFPFRRLDAEALRDGMLASSGELDRRFGGSYIPTERSGNGEVLVKEALPGPFRRSVYLQQRRTQVVGFLEVFDAPSMVFNCISRTSTTVPLQSLSLLNSPFIRRRSELLARRLILEESDNFEARLDHAFQLVWGRSATPAEHQAAIEFLGVQLEEYKDRPNANLDVWTDLVNMLLAANAFIYVE